MSVAGASAADWSILDNVLTASQSSACSGSTSSTDGSFSGSMTIAQIRDAVDKMATSGQLTTSQQIALISCGFQDLNAEDPSYQPDGQTGYTRATAGSFNAVEMLSSYAAFDASYGNSSMAAAYSGLADLLASSSAPNVDAHAEGVGEGEEGG